MIPNATGTMPPPSPWITRATIMTPIDGATAASSEPTASATSVATKTRFLPVMSPTRPRIGVMIDAESRYAVSTHVAAPCVVCSSMLHRRQHRNHQRLQQRERRDAQGQHRERHLIVRTSATDGHETSPKRNCASDRRKPSKPESGFRWGQDRGC